MQLAMERAFIAAKIDWRYLTLDVTPDRLASAFAGMQSLGFRGAHLTGAHRLNAIEHLAHADETAKLARWVDCLSVTGSGLVGHNRWGNTIRRLVGEPVDDHCVVIYGDDPSVLAIGFELLAAGWSNIYFDGMEREIAAKYCERLAIQSSSGKNRWSPLTRAVIIGESADTGMLLNKQKLARLSANSLVLDLSHMGSFSKVTRTAESLQLRAVSGLETLMRYTCETFAAWTGVNAETQLLRESLEEYYEI